MKIAYFTSNRTTFPPEQNQVAASITITTSIINHLAKKHEITLYAAKGSYIDNAEIKDIGLSPFNIDSSNSNNDWVTKAVIGMKQLYLGELFQEANRYDIIHIQTEPIYLAMPYVSLLQTPVLFTLHNTFHEFEKTIYKFYEEKVYLNTISQNQANSLPFSKKGAVIYNGIEVEEFPYCAKADDYFLFLGRLTKEKGIEDYIELATLDTQHLYYVMGTGSNEIEEKLKECATKYTNIKFFQKVARLTVQWNNILSKAKALIVPIEWEEPFGLVMLEAMACGVPVIAYARGSVPEIINDSKTGYIVNYSKNYARGLWSTKSIGLEGLKEAIKTLCSLTEAEYTYMRHSCRRHVELYFSAEKMADAYENLYNKIIQQHSNVTTK